MNDGQMETVYGKEQNIKIDIMKMLNDGKDPYEIIFHMAEYLEETSGEKGYADNVRDCVYSIYGIGLDNEKPLADELAEVQQRCKKMEESIKDISDDDIKKRIMFAVEHHKKFSAFLEEKIKKAKNDK